MKDVAAVPWERGLRAAALDGDAAAWRALYDSAFETVARYARWRSGPHADLADEIAQETWLTAARKLAAFHPEQSPFAAWACGIAANIARNVVRKRLRQTRHVRSLVSVPEPASEAGDDDREAVAVALAELPQHYEAALRARYFEQLSVAEMAARNGESESAAESMLTRARRAFREAYCRRGGSP